MDSESRLNRDAFTPRQERSRRTARRIANAALKLLDRKSFEEISVAEIARTARISVGGFYARFPDKESLLDWFDRNLLDEELERNPPEALQQQWLDSSLDEIVETYVWNGVSFFRRNRRLLARIALSVRSGENSDALQRVRDFNQRMHAPFISALMRHKSEIRHIDPDFAIRFGLMALSASLREAILFGERRLEDIRMSDKELVKELTRFFVSYLRNPA